METSPQAAFAAVLKTLKGNKVMVDTKEDGIYIRLAGKEGKGEAFSLEWAKVFPFNSKSNTCKYAEIELSILSKSATDPDNRPIIEPFAKEILALCDKFGKSGQSGGSAPYTATAISQAVKKLCLQEPICPITGIDDEWNHIREASEDDRMMYQNKRCSAIFKDIDGKCWYLDAIIWKGDTKGESGNDWDTFSGSVEGIRSRQFIKQFPFTPKTFYISVTREMLPDDWNEEPFYENKYYNIERNGTKKLIIEKYRYKIKDHSQLKRVFKYYDKY